MKKNILIGASVIIFFVIVITIYCFIFVKKHNNSGKEINIVTDQERQDANGIVDHVLNQEGIEYTSTVGEGLWQEEKKQWLVISIQDSQKWQNLTQEKKEEMMRGFINTSRLQIDREFGGIRIMSGQEKLMEGFWRFDQGYVIINQ